MIKVEKVSKIYQSDDVPTYALDKVDLLLPNKGMIFIVGKSGSGKSTLLNVIAGFDKPSEGAVYFGQDKLNYLSPKELDYYRNSTIGFVFQDYCLIETFTVKQNIKMAFDYQNKKTSNCKIEDILESVEMKGFGKHYPRQLSAGQKQRIAIARALAKDSKIILADEPTGNLDSKTSIQILDLLKKISEERLVVIVSHNKEDANKYADRIIEISNGKIVADKVKNLGYENNYSISNKVITLPNRTHLSEEQLTEINKTINEGKGSVLVNRGQDEFIDFNGEINTYNVSTSETHMGFMNMLKYSWLFFKNQFFSFFLVVLTVTILITTLSISIQFANYNGNYQFAEAIKASDTTTLILRQDGEVVVGNDVFVGKHMLPFNQEDGEKLKRKFGYDSYDVYNLYYPVAASSAALYKYKDNALDNRGSVNTLMICDMQYLIDTFKDENNKLNYVGNISENEEGIIITDYIADYLLYNYSQSTYTSYQDIFTNPYLYKVYGVKISAIIDTVYDYESYKDGSFEASYNEADYNDLLLYHLSMAYSINPNIIEAHKNDVKEESDYFICHQQMYTTDQGISVDLFDKSLYIYNEYKEDEISLTYDTYNSLFGTECSSYDKSQFKEEYVTLQFNGISQNEIVNKRVKVVGLSGSLYNGISRELLKQLVDPQIFKVGEYIIGVEDPSNIINSVEEYNMYIINSRINVAKLAVKVVAIFSDLFTMVALILVVSIIVLIIINAVNTLNKNIYNIGVSRSMGAHMNELGFIYSLQMIVFGLLVIIFSLALDYFATGFSNSILKNTIPKVIVVPGLNEITFVRFNPAITAFTTLLVVILTIISIIIPIMAIKKMNPVSIIKKKN